MADAVGAPRATQVPAAEPVAVVRRQALRADAEAEAAASRAAVFSMRFARSVCACGSGDFETWGVRRMRFMQHRQPRDLRLWQARRPVLPDLNEAGLEGWRQYLDGVYGLESLDFPFDTAQLTFFYPDVAMPAELRDMLPLLGRTDASSNGSISVGEAILPPGRRRRGISGRDYLDVFRIYHAPTYADGAADTIWVYPYAGTRIQRTDHESDVDANIVPVRSHERVEVHHCADGREQTGYLMCEHIRDERAGMMRARACVCVCVHVRACACVHTFPLARHPDCSRCVARISLASLRCPQIAPMARASTTTWVARTWSETGVSCGSRLRCRRSWPLL